MQPVSGCTSMDSSEAVKATPSVYNASLPEHIATTHGITGHRSCTDSRKRRPHLFPKARRLLSTSTARPLGKTATIITLTPKMFTDYSNSPACPSSHAAPAHDGTAVRDDPQEVRAHHDPDGAPGHHDDYRESGEYAHGDAWHGQYEAHADQYNELVNAVNAMKNSSDREGAREYAQAPGPAAPQGRGNIYHCYSHDSGAALDIQTRCDEAGYNYVALHLSGDPADVGNQRYKQFEADLVRDLRAGEVAGYFADPPC